MKDYSSDNGKPAIVAAAFGGFMVLFYLVMGLLLLFSDIFNGSIASAATRHSLGILFVVYALFRGYRYHRKLKGGAR